MTPHEIATSLPIAWEREKIRAVAPPHKKKAKEEEVTATTTTREEYEENTEYEESILNTDRLG